MEKRIYPTEEDPRYGQRFIIKGVQFIDIDGGYTPMIDVVEVSIKGSRVFEIGHDWSAWRRNKAKISDALCLGLNENARKTREEMGRFVRNPRPNYRDVVALKIIYLEEPGKSYIV